MRGHLRSVIGWPTIDVGSDVYASASMSGGSRIASDIGSLGDHVGSDLFSFGTLLEPTSADPEPKSEALYFTSGSTSALSNPTSGPMCIPMLTYRVRYQFGWDRCRPVPSSSRHEPIWANMFGDVTDEPMSKNHYDYTHTLLVATAGTSRRLRQFQHWRSCRRHCWRQCRRSTRSGAGIN